MKVWVEVRQSTDGQRRKALVVREHSEHSKALHRMEVLQTNGLWRAIQECDSINVTDRIEIEKWE